MRFFTSVYFLILLCIAALAITVLAIKEILRIIAMNKLKQGKGRGSAYVCNMLCQQFPSANIYRNVRLLKREATENGLKSNCDIVYISRGGVLLLTVVGEVGMYDNPKIGPWRHRYMNTAKEVITLQKPNPFDSMAFFASVTEKLLISENVLNPSVSKAVVFSADLVDFTTDYTECLTMETLFDYIRAFNKRSHFNRKEEHRACEAISACSEYLESILPPEGDPETEKKHPKARRTI